MSFVIGQTDRWSDSNSIMDPQILVAGKAIDLPANKAVFYQAMGAPAAAITNDKYDIYSRSQTSQDGLLGDAMLSGGTTDLSMADVDGLTVGSVIQVGTEQLIIKDVDYAAKTVDVYARGAGGTTAASHLSGSAYSVVGIAGQDKELKNVSSMSESTSIFNNFTQLVYEALDYTYLAKVLSRQGLSPDQIEVMLLNESMIRVANMLGNMAINSLKQEGNTALPQMTAGLIQQLASNRVSAGAVFSEAVLKGGIEAAANYGNPNTIIVSPANKLIASAFNLSASNVNVQEDRASTVAGGYIDRYVWEGLTLNFMVDADMPSDKVAIVDINKCEKGWLVEDALRVTEEPALSSRELRKAIQGSIGFAIRDEREHCLIHNIG